MGLNGKNNDRLGPELVGDIPNTRDFLNSCGGDSEASVYKGE